MKKNTLLLLSMLFGSFVAFSETHTFDFSTMYSNAQNLISETPTTTDGQIMLSFAKNTASTNPTYYDSGSSVRFYQNSSGSKGGGLTITTPNGATITGVSATLDQGASAFRYDIGSGDVDFSSLSVSGLSSSLFECYTVGTSKSTRVYIQTLTVEYSTPAGATKPEITSFTPVSGSEFERDSSFTISTTVTTADGDGIDSVCFVTEDMPYDTIKMTPAGDVYSTVKTIDATGTYSGRIVAFGGNGEIEESDSHSVTIYVPGPVISNVTPESGLVFDLGVDVVISAEASTSVGVIDSVVLYFGPAPDFLVRRERCDFSEGVYSSIRYFDAESTFYGQLVAYGSNGENDSTDIVTAFGQCGDRTAPVASEASTITPTSFVANWGATLDAEAYMIDVWMESSDQMVIIDEDFATGVSPFPTGWTKNSKVYTEGTKAYNGKSIKLGSSGNIGYLETPALDVNGDIVVEFQALQYSSSENKISVSFAEDGVNYGTTQDQELTDTWTRYSFAFSGTGNMGRVKFSTFNSSQERAYIDSVVVKTSGVLSTYLIKDSIVGDVNSYPIVDLSSGTDYYYSLKAITEFGCESDTSNHVMVTTDDVPTSLPQVSEKLVSIFASQGVINIQSAELQEVTVYEITGRQVAKQMVSGDASISVGSGIYLVKVAGQVTKVAVQ